MDYPRALPRRPLRPSPITAALAEGGEPESTDVDEPPEDEEEELLLQMLLNRGGQPQGSRYPLR